MKLDRNVVMFALVVVLVVILHLRLTTLERECVRVPDDVRVLE